MRKRKAGIIILPLILILIEYYAYSGIHQSFYTTHPHLKLSAFIIYGLMCAAFWYGVFSFAHIRTKHLQTKRINFFTTLLMGFFIARILLAGFVLTDDLRRLILYFISHAMPERSILIARIGTITGIAVWLFLFTGIRNQYRYKIRRVDLKFDRFPDAFKGMKVVHISDIHAGSFANKKEGREAVSKGIDMILNEKPDIVFFTGDLVNDISRELLYFKDLFRKVQAPLGVYSILGNHDYGDYVSWPDEASKIKNFNDLKRHHSGLGWRLLLNENRILVNQGDSIAIIGVENWSAKSFRKYGDLEKAYGDLSPEEPSFKILLSHDPTHWEAEVLKKYPDINLTFSGHTHGFQFGFRNKGKIQFSPIQLFYKHWAGLYQKGNQYLYINTGFGFIGYPGRIGILPEITVLTLS